MPVIGDSMRTLLRFSFAFSTVACSCVMRRRWVSICRSCEFSSAWRTFTWFSAFSSASLVVSPCFQSCCWRAKLSCACFSAVCVLSSDTRSCSICERDAASDADVWL